ncbi:hypothetical protein OSTOST_10537, partial [Ostertagia ostertagi]
MQSGHASLGYVSFDSAWKPNAASCGSDSINSLYEMDDGWICRKCAAQSAKHQIRVDRVPIELPFALPPGITTYDVLPSILPLPLVNFYTKHAAVKLIEQALGHIELLECPGCKQAVELCEP